MARDVPLRTPRNGFVVEYVDGRERTIQFRRPKEVMIEADSLWEAELIAARRGETSYRQAVKKANKVYDEFLARYDRIHRRIETS